MDAVEFIKAIKRRAGARLGYFRIDAATDPEALVQDMEQWVLEHPHKTRQSEFLKQWPHAKMTNQGILPIQPCDIDTKSYEDCGLNCDGYCDQCRRDFWMQEVE